MGNETDRDLAEQLTDLISDCKTLLETINDNKYVPHITTQPTHYTGAIGDNAVFTVVANNVKAYSWQMVETEESTSWADLGAYTDTLTLNIQSARLNYRFRCAITGLDNSVIYTNVVKMIESET